MIDIMDLPDEIMLEMFSYLNFHEMSVVAVVCRRWSQLIADENFWRNGLWKKHSMFLIYDKEKIHLTERLSHPPNSIIYDPNGSSKDLCHLYDSEIIRLAKERREKMRKENITLKERLYKWWSSSPSEPKKPNCNLILTGLGLECIQTSRIGRNIIYGRNSTFHSLGMSPSSTPGIGSGVLVKYADHTILNIITLYSNTKLQRENSSISTLDRLKQNRLLQVCESMENCENEKNGNLPECQLVPAAQTVCCRTDGVIYVVNGTEQTVKEENIDCIQLHAIAKTLNSLTTKSIPFLILSCINTAQTPRYSWSHIAESLKLWQLPNIAWHICNTEVDTMNGVPKGFEWLIHKVKQNFQEQIIPDEAVPDEL